jgi:hypothetical protein
LIADLFAETQPPRPCAHENLSVRLPFTDIERTRKPTEKRRAGYRTVIKLSLHTLKRESRIA